MKPVPVTLRGHHLLCMLSYQSQGYSPEFVARFDEVVDRINAGAPIQVCSGPDTLCETMLNDADCHCHNASVTERDRLALKVVGEVLQQSLNSESRLTLDAANVKAMRRAFADGRLRGACEGCEWTRLCSRIARQGYREVRLFPGTVGEDA